MSELEAFLLVIFAAMLFGAVVYYGWNPPKLFPAEPEPEQPEPVKECAPGDHVYEMIRTQAGITYSPCVFCGYREPRCNG